MKKQIEKNEKVQKKVHNIKKKTEITLHKPS